jgi:Xaa-Pro aminopeptidase
MRHRPISSELFKKNREKLRRHLPANSMAVFVSNDPMPSNGDLTFRFRQSSDFFYLTGVDQEESMLIIYPDAPKEEWREVLLVRETNEHLAIWEGEKLTQKEAAERSGIEHVLWSHQFDALLKQCMLSAETVYLNLNENPRFDSPVPRRERRFARELQERFPLHQYRRAAPILKQLRRVKEPEEVELMKEACGITHEAFNKVLQFVQPGVREYEVEGLITGHFLSRGANGHAYHPILASGKNSCVLHYEKNDQTARSGDLMLMDFGCEYGYYASDMTRTIPVSGQFSGEQREVYQAVLRVMKAAREKLRPGLRLEDYEKEVGEHMQQELLDLKLLTQEEIDAAGEDKPAYRKYFMHGTSHYMGLDVHDVGSKFDPLEPGNVFSCEPGIYLRDKGFGIRLENDILVTAEGPVDLMQDIPLEPDDIEQAMKH